MLRLLYILILLPFVGFSQLKTDSQLTNDLNNLVPNNTSQLIKPGHIRTVIQNGYDSRVSMYGETGILGKLTYATLFPFTDPKDLVNKKYVDDAVIGFSGGVTSFNARTGAIVPLSTDYSAYYYPASGNPSGFLTTIPTLTAADIPNLDASKITTGTLADARISSAATWNAKQNAIGLTTTGTSGAATLIGSTLNIPQYAGGVTSVFSRTGAIVAQSGDYNTSQVTENTNLYFTNARAQAAISATAPILYTSGVISMPAAGTFTSGFVNTGIQDFGGVKSFSSPTKMVTIQDFAGNDIIDVSVNNVMTVKGGTMKVNYLAGTGVRTLEADALGSITATGRRNRTLMTTVYNPATQHTSATEADFGSYTIPAGLMDKDGDAIKLEVTGQLLAPSGVNSLAGWFGGTFVFSKTFSGGSTTRAASLFFTVIRTSNTTAVIHIPEPINAQTTINTSNGDLITRTGLNFTTNTYVIKATMAGDGTSSGAALAAVRVTFEPAP